MEYRRMGRTGLQLSTLSLGAWITFGSQIEEATAETCMVTAYEAGVNFFDNAEAYADGRAEDVMGRILRRQRWARETFVVSSKVFWGGSHPNQTGLSRKHVIECCHAALRRLQVDYLDLYFCHRPDPDVPVDETVRAMHDLVASGKVLYWGTSEWSAAQVRAAHAVAVAHGLHRPVVEQPQYNLFHRERVEVELAPLYDTLGLGTTIWSPLMSGLLTGKYAHGTPGGTRVSLPGYEWLAAFLDEQREAGRFDHVEALGHVARTLECTPAQLAIAWCTKNPHVSTVITGATSVKQLQENLESLAVAKRLDAATMAKIDQIVGGGRS